MQKVFAILTLLSLLLSGCGTFEIYLESTPAGESVLPALSSTSTAEPRLSLNSSSEEIRLAMLESATKWKSIWMDGTVTYYAMEGTDSQTTTRHSRILTPKLAAASVDRKARVTRARAAQSAEWKL